MEQAEKNKKIKYFEWTQEHEDEAKSIINEDSETLDDRIYTKYEDNAHKFWDIFFKQNGRNFYKDRHYIDREFGLEELIAKLKEEKERRLRLIEIGCAVGNTIFPLSEKYSEDLFIYGFDFSKNAIDLVRINHQVNLELKIKHSHFCHSENSLILFLSQFSD